MAVILIVFAVFVAGMVYLFMTTPTGFVPAEDQGDLMSSVKLPEAASLQRTEVVINHLAEVVRNSPGVVDTLGVSGFSLIDGTISNVGTVIAVLAPWDQRRSKETQWHATMDTLDAEMNKTPEATAVVFPGLAIPRLGSSGGIAAELLDINGGSIQQLDAVKTAFLTALNAAPEFKQVFGNFSAATPRYYLAVDRDRAGTLVVDISDIYEVLQANLGSYL